MKINAIDTVMEHQRRIGLKTRYAYGFMSVVFASFVWSIATPYMALASLSYASLLAGYLLRRRNPIVHGILMTAGIVGDLALVLALEIQRHAVQTAISFKLNGFQQAHIGFSSAATALYVPLLVMGFMMMSKPQNRARFGTWHSRLGNAAFVFRTLGFLLMFSMLKHTSGN